MPKGSSKRRRRQRVKPSRDKDEQLDVKHKNGNAKSNSFNLDHLKLVERLSKYDITPEEEIHLRCLHGLKSDEDLPRKGQASATNQGLKRPYAYFLQNILIPDNLPKPDKDVQRTMLQHKNINLQRNISFRKKAKGGVTLPIIPGQIIRDNDYVSNCQDEDRLRLLTEALIISEFVSKVKDDDGLKGDRCSFNKENDADSVCRISIPSPIHPKIEEDTICEEDNSCFLGNISMMHAYATRNNSAGEEKSATTEKSSRKYLPVGKERPTKKFKREEGNELIVDVISVEGNSPDPEVLPSKPLNKNGDNKIASNNISKLRRKFRRGKDTKKKNIENKSKKKSEHLLKISQKQKDKKQKIVATKKRRQKNVTTFLNPQAEIDVNCLTCPDCKGECSLTRVTCSEESYAPSFVSTHFDIPCQIDHIDTTTPNKKVQEWLDSIL